MRPLSLLDAKVDARGAGGPKQERQSHAGTGFEGLLSNLEADPTPAHATARASSSDAGKTTLKQPMHSLAAGAFAGRPETGSSSAASIPTDSLAEARAVPIHAVASGGHAVDAAPGNDKRVAGKQDAARDDVAAPPTLRDLVQGLAGPAQPVFSVPSSPAQVADAVSRGVKDGLPPSQATATGPASVARSPAGIVGGAIVPPGRATATLMDIVVTSATAPALPGGFARRLASRDAPSADGASSNTLAARREPDAGGKVAIVVETRSGGDRTPGVPSAGAAADTGAEPGQQQAPGQGASSPGAATSDPHVAARGSLVRTTEAAAPIQPALTDPPQPSATTMAPPLRAIVDSAVALAAEAAAATTDPAGGLLAAPAKTMTLRLSDGDLGTIGVRLHLVGQSLELRLSVPDEHTARLVGRDREALTGALREQNLELRSLVIQGGDAPRPGENNASPNNPAGDGSRPDSGRDTSGSPRDGGARQPPPAPDRPIDSDGPGPGAGARPKTLFV